MSNTDKSIDIYERLATALEALPHGFARTTSGVEIKLIKMAFTPEEVGLAGQLTRVPETAVEIATRVGRDEVEVTALLESLVPRGLVSLNSPAGTAGGGVLDQTVQGEKKYRLRPFLVGWYEASMRRLDKEFAELFEQFVIEGGGERIFSPRPGVLGVVPVRGSLSPEQMKEAEPHLDIDAHFERHERFLVIDCVCRREAEILKGHSCEKPMKRCGFVGLPPQTPLGETVLDREEASKLLTSSASRVTSTSPSTASPCSPTRRSSSAPATAAPAVARSSTARRSPVWRKDPRNRTTAPSLIRKRALPAARASSAAQSTPSPKARHRLRDVAMDDKSLVERDKCIGCGVCVIGCPTDAIALEPVSAEEWFHVPSSMAEWEERRLAYLAAEK